ncbi:MAG TPA: nuclear transport factor 2 family protein [Solirubrobacterales bacterium]
MDDAVAGYGAASESNDIDALMATLAPDVEVVSPLSGRMVFRGHDDVRILLGAVYSTVREMRWNEKVGDGPAQILVGTFKIGPLRASDAMAFDLDAHGRIGRVRPHLRPWLATTLFALLLGPRVARHPGVLWRALRGGPG